MIDMLENFFTKIWYGKTLSCRISRKSGTAAAVPAVPVPPHMEFGYIYRTVHHIVQYSFRQERELGWP